MRQRESAVLNRHIESGPEGSMALYVVFMEAFAFELTVGAGRPGCNDIQSTFPAIVKIILG